MSQSQKQLTYLHGGIKMKVGIPTMEVYKMDAAIKEYDAKIDTKKRITLRGSSYEYYHVTE